MYIYKHKKVFELTCMYMFYRNIYIYTIYMYIWYTYKYGVYR